ncbi:MAG: extracellular solute-binding protein [Actinomycetota bacterium]
MSDKRTTRWRLLAVLLAFGLVAAACGGSDDDSSSSASEAAEESSETTAAAEESTEEEGEAMAESGPVVILSTQGVPVEESEAIRSNVLSIFDGETDFVGVESPVLLERVLAEAESGEGEVGVTIALHGDYPTLAEAGALTDLSDIDVSSLGISDSLLRLGQFDGEQLYIPVFQATYLMAANRKALEFLPEGADINALTWDQLAEWGTNIEAETGAKRLGFPAADDGLLHRFAQGYLYPSFTGGMVTNFNSPEAVEMWDFMGEMWADSVNPQAPTYSFLQDQLLSEEVWVAFDHQARLVNALNDRPDDFVAFPAPTGPEGLGFMPVVVGIGIPASAPDPAASMALVEHMLSDEGQQAIARSIGFFGVTAAPPPSDLPVGAQAEAEAIAVMSNSAEALPALLPVGLGERGGEISQIYRDTFNRIVIGGEDAQTVLDEQGTLLQTLLDETGAPCWAPDAPSSGACQLAVAG